MIHHGGRFTEPPKRKYVEGEVTYVDLIDIKQCKIDMLDTVMYQCLGSEERLFYHYKLLMKSLDCGLRSLVSDSDISEKIIARDKVDIVTVMTQSKRMEGIIIGKGGWGEQQRVLGVRSV